MLTPCKTNSQNSKRQPVFNTAYLAVLFDMDLLLLFQTVRETQ